MSKIESLVDIGSLANTTSARAAINQNSEKIEAAFQNTVSRDGSQPNQMEADFDLNDHYLLNVADPVNEADGVNLRSVRPLVEQFAADIVAQAVFGTLVVDVFPPATAGQTDFSLSEAPGAIETVEVVVDGLDITPGSDYTLVGSQLQTLQLTSPLLGGEEVVARYVKALPAGTAEASAVRYNQGSVGAITRSAQDHLRARPVLLSDFGAQGGGVVDETAKIQKALDTGRDVLVEAGKTYIVAALTMNTPGQRLMGSGTLKAAAGANYQLLRVLANDVVIDGVRFDGTASKPNTGQVNDIIRVESVSGVKVQNCRINGSKGGGVAILNSSKCVVSGNYITGTNDNGVLVANLGADDNIVANNIIIGTFSQNCIFLTADSSSMATSDYIYRNAVVGNVCRDAIDTGIEVGQHCVDSTVSANVVYNCANPEILIRDAIGTVVSGNVVNCGPNGSASHDGIAWLVHNDTNVDYRGICANNTVYGRITRSGILIQGVNNLLVTGNRIQESTATVNGTTGAGLVGIGIQVEASSYGIRIHGNDIRRMEYGVLFNVAGAALTFTDCSVKDNTITQVSQGLAFANTTFVRSRFSGNVIASPVLYAINNNGANGSNNSSVDNNAYQLSGFSGAAPVAVNIPDWASRSFTEAGGNDSGWQPAVFQNSWADLGGAYQTVAYRKVGGVVYLRGLAAGGTTTDGTAVFTLPSGFRPSATEAFTMANSASPTNDTRIEISSAGAVAVYGTPNNAYITFSGMSFYAN